MERFFQSYYVKIFELIAITIASIAAILASYQFIEERENREISRQIQKDEAIARSWSMLSTKASGNSGKGFALTQLTQAGIPLSNIDLSCKTMNPLNWLEEEDISNNETDVLAYAMYIENPLDFERPKGMPYCKLNTFITKVNMRGAIANQADFSGSSIYLADFRESLITGVSFASSYLSNVDFTLAKIKNRSSFRFSTLKNVKFNRTSFGSADFSYSDISGTSFTDSYVGASKFIGANITNVVFHNIDQSVYPEIVQNTFIGDRNYIDFRKSFFWKGGPPQGLPLGIEMYACDSNAATEYILTNRIPLISDHKINPAEVASRFCERCVVDITSETGCYKEK